MAACFFKSLTLFGLFVFSAVTAQEFPDSIPMNEIRVLASHNSYKIQPTPRTMKFINRFSEFMLSHLTFVMMILHALCCKALTSAVLIIHSTT